MQALPRRGWLWGALLAAACGSGRVSTGVAPPPPLHEPGFVRFVAIGDVGKGNEAQARVARGVKALCERERCDFLLLLGDNLYPRGMQSADDPRMEEIIGAIYEDVAPAVYLVLGNHDYGKGRDKQSASWQIAWVNQRQGFEMPSQAWRMDAGPARIIGLDTNAALQFGGDFQKRWLHEQLSAPMPWKIVLGHHPYRSNGRHGNAGAYEGTLAVPFVSGSTLRDLFDEELCTGADLYLSGHEHSRQLISWCGVPLVVSGSGASSTEIIDRGNDPLFASASLGSVLVELGPQGGFVRFAGADGDWDSQPFPITPR